MTINEDDYYEILGVNCECNDKQLKSAFRKLAMQYHPDHNSSKEAEQKFKKICEAYEVLKNPEKRAAYNQFYHETFKDNHKTFTSSKSQDNIGLISPLKKIAFFAIALILYVGAPILYAGICRLEELNFNLNKAMIVEWFITGFIIITVMSVPINLLWRFKLKISAYLFAIMTASLVILIPWYANW
ncbi:chaperone dnaJ [Bartonella rattimassiliensis 15908]|uniref:Chaperone dnaJ n=1 Tax=Bartonella rattimassiliensis 15908 TaxID=1094556 RepID=J0ZHW3_9HYPH|nr:chaperone dnaJ [Bartonella rattimassiliensis 15908]